MVHIVAIFGISDKQPEPYVGLSVRSSDGTFTKIWRTSQNIRINLISPENRVHAEHFCWRQYGSTFISFYATVFEIHATKFWTYLCKNRIYVKDHSKSFKITYFRDSCAEELRRSKWYYITILILFPKIPEILRRRFRPGYPTVV